jgi:hypothetical protein
MTNDKNKKPSADLPGGFDRSSDPDPGNLPAQTPSGAAAIARIFGHAMTERDRIERAPLPRLQAR